MRPFETWITQERGEGRLAKKGNKSDVRGRSQSKKCNATHSKKPQDFASDVCFFEWPLWCWLNLLYFLWVYLLMMSLAFYETNNPYISK